MINQEDGIFLEKRKKMQRYWPVIGTLMIVMLLGLSIYLLVSSPRLINPMVIVDEVRANTADPRTLALLAVMCPVLTIFLFLTVIVVIIYVWAFMILESKYHKIIDRMSKPDEIIKKEEQTVREDSV